METWNNEISGTCIVLNAHIGREKVNKLVYDARVLKWFKKLDVLPSQHFTYF